MAKPTSIDSWVLLQAHTLIGCDWGRVVGFVRGDLCPRFATQRIMLHGRGDPIIVKLCDLHTALTRQHTEPHAEDG